MPVINLASEYSTLLDQRFKQKSLTEAHCGHKYSWNGVNSINVWTVGTMKLHTYDPNQANNRFTGGANLENVGDELNTYVLSQNKSFSAIIDSYSNADQKSIKKAQAIMKDTWDEEVVPVQDMYRLQTWAEGAGVGAIGAALTSKTIVKAILDAQAALNNRLAPREGRVCFISETLAVECKLAAELAYNQNYTQKTIVNGEICRLGGLPIVAVPDHYMPAGVQFMIKWKGATADPQKLKMLRVLNEVQGIYGPVMEGLVRYDSFVLAQKANGIYTFSLTGSAVAAPTITVSGSTATIAGEGTIKYTTDGSNPKMSKTVQEGKTVTLTGSGIVRAIAVDGGKTSTIAEAHFSV